MKKLSLFIIVAMVLLTACAPKAAEMPKAELPAGKAWAEGKEIYFVHTEASDAGVPDESLANVYVFTNGIAGSGPFGFQADVFDNPPGTNGYTPLRRLNVITWTDETKARELKSVSEVLDAETAGELTIEQPGVVINMPFVIWDGGKR